MRVMVDTTGGRWSASTPAKLLEPGYYEGGGALGPTYDISPDDQRFVMMKTLGAEGRTNTQAQIIVVQHFDEELKRLAPGTR